MWQRRVVNTLLSLALVTLSFHSSARAAVVSTDALLDAPPPPHRTDDGPLAARLEVLGVSPQLARSRVAGLTPAERAHLGARLDHLPAGGDAIGALAFVALVLLLTDLLGLTDVYPFVTHTLNGDKTAAQGVDGPPAVTVSARR